MTLTHGIVPIWLILFASLFSATACSSEKPPIEEDRYIMILAELELVYSVYRASNDSSLTMMFINDVFAKYDTDAAAFAVAHRYYESNISAQNRRYEQVSNILTEENNRLNNVEVQVRNRPAMQQNQSEVSTPE